MEGQEFLYNAIKAKMDPDESLDSIKFISRTTLRETEVYPAVFVEEEPFDFNQTTGQGGVVVKTYNCNLIILVESNNINELTEDQYKDTKDLLDDKTKEVIVVILEAAQTFDKLGNLKLGRGEVYDGVISSTPVMWNMIPVELTLVN